MLASGGRVSFPFYRCIAHLSSIVNSVVQSTSNSRDDTSMVVILRTIGTADGLSCAFRSYFFRAGSIFACSINISEPFYHSPNEHHRNPQSAWAETTNFSSDDPGRPGQLCSAATHFKNFSTLDRRHKVQLILNALFRDR